MALKYRSDIDGLRAIAVLVVVIFHLSVPGFEGGYVGVDIFFVISGYLITSIILRDIESSSFTLGQFYTRRIRRLIPPLIATVVGTTVAAVFVLSPHSMIAYARSAVAALFSVSNFVFFSEAGYWDTESELKPLLHTWSLGVEEQFYLFWPALLIGLWALRNRVPLWVSFALLSLVSFIGCVWYTTISESAAFYLLPFRVFQFALGALALFVADYCARFTGKSLNGGLFIVGMLLIAVSVATFGEAVLFPGWVVIIPTVGAMLVLIAGANGLPRLCAIAMQNPVMLWFGRVSYSMYLVHWPAVALYRYEFGLQLDPPDQLLLATLVLLFTLLLHYGVERRFYRRSYAQTEAVPHGRFAAATVFVSVLCAAVLATAWLGTGWQWRKPSMQLTPSQIEEGKADRFAHTRSACRVHFSAEDERCRKFEGPNILVFGNSHEPDGYNFLHGYLQESGLPSNITIFGTTNDCKHLNVQRGEFVTSNKKCQQRLDALFAPEFVQSTDLLLYATDNPFRSRPALRRIIERLKQMNPEMKLAILGGYIHTTRHCAHLINESGRQDACIEPDNVRYFEQAPEDAPKYSELMRVADLYIDRVGLLCPGRQLANCASVAEDGTPMFYDRHHHSRPFAEMTGRRYAREHPDRPLL